MFPPAFGPRMGYLCKYMQKAGWSPTVITEQIPDQTFEFLCGDIPVTYISYYKAKGKVRLYSPRDNIWLYEISEE